MVGIKGTEMPSKCRECMLYDPRYTSGCVLQNRMGIKGDKSSIFQGRHENCPLIEAVAVSQTDCPWK